MKVYNPEELAEIMHCVYSAPGMNNATDEKDNLGQIVIYTGIFKWSDNTWRDAPENKS